MGMQNVLKALMFTPGPKGVWGLPAVFVGAPGVAKTSIIEQTAETWGTPMETLIASLREPSDFLGQPVPTDGGIEYLPAKWAVNLAKQARGVAFLDELSTAPPVIQSALLRIILDRYVGDLHMPNTRFLAAMNRPEDTAGGGYELVTPLVNRVILLDWDPPTLQEWQNYMMGGGTGESGSATKAEQEEARVLAAWPAAFATARGIVIGFSAKAPHLMHVQPKSGDASASKPWPSRRSWEMVTRVLAGSKIHGLSDIQTHTLIAGCVGPGAAGEFLAYLENADMPAPEDLLKGKVKWAPDVRLDRTMAVLASCTSFVLSSEGPDKSSLAEKLWGLLLPIVDTQADLVLPHAEILCFEKLSSSAAASKVVMKLGPVMQAARLLS